MVPPTDGRVPILFLFHILGVDAEAEVDRKCTNTQGREAVLLAVPSYDKYALPRALKKNSKPRYLFCNSNPLEERSKERVNLTVHVGSVRIVKSNQPANVE